MIRSCLRFPSVPRSPGNWALLTGVHLRRKVAILATPSSLPAGAVRVRCSGVVAILLADRLRLYGRMTPHPWAALVFSVLAGGCIAGLYRFGGRLGLRMPLFAKEGFLENLTFFLEFWAAVMCALSARRAYRQRRDGDDVLIAIAYAVCAAVLFVVAMEEISWGQQLVAFRTPQVWEQLNQQHETTLHNLASKEALTSASKLVAGVFAAGVILLSSAALLIRRKWIEFIAPHPCLVPLALLTGYAGIRLHPEVVEVLLSIFFAFYGYRIYVASALPLR